MSHRAAHLTFLCALASIACAGPLPASFSAAAFDPVASDAPAFDARYPPRLVETRFASSGAAMNAVIYEAQGPGPHPTVLLLHGFPGFEKNLDLAQSIRRAGWNVVFFHYRGTWGSEGRFSITHVLEDVAAVVDGISAADFARDHRIDAERLVAVGHSMGGFAALVSAAELDAIRCVGSLAGANFGELARAARADPRVGAAMAASLDGWSGPVVGSSGRALVAEVVGEAERFDTLAHAATLARKPVLLVAGEGDDVTPVTGHHTPLADALQQAGAASLETSVLADADHAFSGRRIALARRVVGWLEGECESSLSR